MKKGKTLCLFCTRQHRAKVPALCKAKGDIIRAYIKSGVKLWQVMAGIHRGLLDLEHEARMLVKARKAKA